ncbi:MAG: response regulator transcription factor [Moorea sp. SIO4A1]|uniref:response regulator n=1 Tax=Moorena sp. SIO4A1 TaxID=2607835 RepID=UPI00144DECF7|nr:response regulator transcription factor [Moorena sp. SIO4A1]NEQ62608.1 response regulator transcription factor [Moorena sp. SIO4A1]
MVNARSDGLIINQDLPNTSNLKILVVDDHQLILKGTIKELSQQYPDAEIVKAKTAQQAQEEIANSNFDLLVMDLCIPEKPGMSAEIDTGIYLLKKLLQNYPQQNFLVQSSHVKTLVRIKHEIDNYEGGFVIAEKELSESEMLLRVDLALKGATHTRDIKTGLELKPEWLDVLKLASEEELTDKQISERMYKCERAVRTYWTKIQDVLGIYPQDCKQEGKNIRITTLNRAREEGLID